MKHDHLLRGHGRGIELNGLELNQIKAVEFSGVRLGPWRVRTRRVKGRSQTPRESRDRPTAGAQAATQPTLGEHVFQSGLGGGNAGVFETDTYF